MKPITFDRFARWLIIATCLIVAYLVFSYLSSVLIPFIVAGVIAYLLNPVCDFLQHRCRLRFRIVCVLLTLILACGIVAGLLWLCIPPMFEECLHLTDIVRRYVAGVGTDNSTIPVAVRRFAEHTLRDTEAIRYIEAGDYITLIKNTLPRVWDLLTTTASAVVSVVASLISLLYLFFLLLDYDRYAAGWADYVPLRYRRQARIVVGDVSHYLCGYFRGQMLIALSNCLMFTVGFLILGFPMPVALGCFIGIVSFVPYLQVIGFVPATVLAILRAAETGDNFWGLLGGVLLVYIVVQVLQDTIVTPRVMGHIMGLSPAIILLSLSVGAFVGGIGGLIIALPLTTIGLMYYRRYVVGEAVEAGSDGH